MKLRNLTYLALILPLLSAGCDDEAYALDPYGPSDYYWRPSVAAAVEWHGGRVAVDLRGRRLDDDVEDELEDALELIDRLRDRRLSSRRLAGILDDDLDDALDGIAEARDEARSVEDDLAILEVERELLFWLDYHLDRHYTYLTVRVSYGRRRADYRRYRHMLDRFGGLRRRISRLAVENRRLRQHRIGRPGRVRTVRPSRPAAPRPFRVGRPHSVGTRPPSRPPIRRTSPPTPTRRRSVPRVGNTSPARGVRSVRPSRSAVVPPRSFRVGRPHETRSRPPALPPVRRISPPAPARRRSVPRVGGTPPSRRVRSVRPTRPAVTRPRPSRVERRGVDAGTVRPADQAARVEVRQQRVRTDRGKVAEVRAERRRDAKQAAAEKASLRAEQVKQRRESARQAKEKAAEVRAERRRDAKQAAAEKAKLRAEQVKQRRQRVREAKEARAARRKS